MKKTITIFLLSLALSLPLVAQAGRKPVKPMPVGSAFKKVEKQNSSLVRICGVACANKIKAIQSRLGSEVKSFMEQAKNLSLGSEAQLATATALSSLPSVHMKTNKEFGRTEADKITRAIMVAGSQSGRWEPGTRNRYNQFVEGVKRHGLTDAVKKTFPGVSAKEKARELKENCRL